MKLNESSWLFLKVLWLKDSDSSFFFFENFDRMIFQSHPKKLHPKNLLKLFIIIDLYRIVSVQRVTILEIEASRHKKIHRKQVFLAKYWLIQSVYHTEKTYFILMNMLTMF